MRSLTVRAVRDIAADLESKRGLLIAFEGPDGSGKTTQRKLFKTWLKSEGRKVKVSKWNSSDLINPLIKARKTIHALSPLEYSLLHAADYRHRLETEILPALAAGYTVLTDRYFFTALARDIARGLELDYVLKLFAPILWPDAVFFFAVSEETSDRRVRTRGTPSYYEAGQDVTDVADAHASYRQFVGRIIQEYAALAAIFQFVTVDAERSVYEQHKAIRVQFEKTARRSWPDYNQEAVADWLNSRPEIALGQR